MAPLLIHQLAVNPRHSTHHPLSNEFFMTNPWLHVDELGSDLNVNDFLTTQILRVGNALKRKITIPYVIENDLTVSEWRILSVIANEEPIAFSNLVILSTTDKSLVSRTLKLLESKGLIQLDYIGSTPRKKILCSLTSQGQQLHAKIIPKAQQAQATMIRELNEQERVILYTALNKLHQKCVD